MIGTRMVVLLRCFSIHIVTELLQEKVLGSICFL